MPIIYPDNIKVARMTAVKTALGVDGKLEVGTTGMTEIISEVPLGDGGSISTDAIWSLTSAPASDPAANVSARASEARIRSALNEDVVTGLTVGLKADAAPAWAGATSYSLGAFVTNGTNQYKCITAGISATTGGPTGTGGAIVDGTVTWEYCAAANADIQVSNVDVTLGEAFEVTIAKITHA